MDLASSENSQQHFPVKEKLHTDILEQKYGSIHAIVLRHDDIREVKDDDGIERIREAKLVDEKNILRTYGLTFLTYDKNNQELVGIDSEIRQGGLIGKTFRQHGYSIKKNVIDVFMTPIPTWMKDDFKVDEEEAKARLTEFYAKKENTTPVIYGTVLEIYSPDFKNPKDGINDIDITQINPVTNTLKEVGISTNEIWELLDNTAATDKYGDLKDRYEQAQILSQTIVQSLHEKILKYIQVR